ncbi:MAG: winged helix-turn-helix domain-containing protein [Sulfobacillus thermotolerans]|nr:winged helix-turn-helix domain-containing protein [Sulfobacillus thermotolerans]
MGDRLLLSSSVMVDFSLHGVWRNGAFSVLPARTWNILAYLAEHPNRVISSEQLLAVGWPGELRAPADLSRHIHRIRQLIEPDSSSSTILVTYRGVGYCLKCRDSSSSFVS